MSTCKEYIQVCRQNPVWCRTTRKSPLMFSTEDQLFSLLFIKVQKRLGTREIAGWSRHRFPPPYVCLYEPEQSPAPFFSVLHHGADRRVGQVELARDVCGWVLLQKERKNEKQKTHKSQVISANAFLFHQHVRNGAWL